MRNLLAVFALLIISAGAFAQPAPEPAEPEVVVGWRFDSPESIKGWGTVNWENLEFRDGVLQGASRYDCNLAPPPVQFEAERVKVVGLRVRSDTGGGGELFYRRGSEPFVDDRAINWELTGDNEWHDIYVPITDPQWHGTITAVRFDPINPAARLSVAWLRLLTAMPNDRVLNGGFEQGTEGWSLQGRGQAITPGARGERALRLDAGARAASSPIDFSFLGTYRLRARGRGGKGSLTLQFRDLDGRPVGAPVALSAGGAADWQPASVEFRTPSLAADGVLTLSAGAGAAVEWDAVAVDELERFRVDAGAPTGLPWSAQWIWHPRVAPDSDAFFRKAFDLPAGKMEHALVLVTGDDAFTLFLNGERIAQNDTPDGWRSPKLLDLAGRLRAGRNVLAMQAHNNASAAGVLLEGEVVVGGKKVLLTTDASWKVSPEAPAGWEKPEFDDSAWGAANAQGRPPATPWGALQKLDLGVLEPAAVVSRQVPARAAAGGSIRIAATFRTRAQGAIVSELVRGELRIPLAPAGGWPVKRQGETLTVGPATVALPPFLPGGKYRLRFGPAGTTLMGRAQDQFEGPEITVTPRKPGPLAKAEVRPHHGTPTLFLNGKPDTGMHYIHIRDVPFHIKNISGAGVHLFVVDVGNIGWVGPDQYDYDNVDRMCLSVLMHDPNAYIIPTFDLSGKAFPFWRTLVPKEEWTVTADGKNNVGDYSGGRNDFPSLASPTYARLSQEAARRFARHLYASPWADRVVGYWPCDGISWEWFPWGAQSQEFVDYSPAYRKAFQEWTRRLYGDLAGINRTWGTQYASLEEIPVPTKEERLTTDRLAFRDPAGPLRRVSDFYRFHHEQVADRIDAYARVFKEESGGRHVVGTYYGYVFYLPESPFFGAHSGHFAVNRYLASPNLDFGCSPTPYGHVRAVGAPSGFMTAPESFRRAGKLWIQQADIRTHWTTQAFSPTKTIRESAEVLRREFALSFVKGHIAQWYDFSLGWTGGDPRLGAVIRQLQSIGQKNLDAPRVSPADTLAVVVDETNIYAQRPDRPLMGGPLSYEMRYALGQMGLPYDTFLVSDLPRPGMRKYRAYLFVDCFRLTEEQRKAVDALKLEGRVLALAYAPGILSESAYRPERVGEVVGQKIAFEDAEGPLRVRLTERAHPLAAGVRDPAEFGAHPSYKSGPRPRVEDPEAQVIGRYIGDGPAAVSVKKHPQWTSVFTAAPIPSSEFLRNLARLAGLHVYLDTGDAVYASDRLVAVHTRAGGTKTIRLPARATVTDLFTGKVVARGVKEFTVPMAARTTGIWGLQTR